MSKPLQIVYQEAVSLLRALTTPQGIMASTIAHDNYKRVWARDSIICGIAGILANDDTVVEGLKQSLYTLADYQHPNGMIPSNVLKEEESADVSYGSLVGRVDTNTWFIVGACLYYLHTKNAQDWLYFKPVIEKSRVYLKSIEFNGKGWIYTPISGNWADEYPVQGYTLYDNCLRQWGERLWLTINDFDTTELELIHNKTFYNFWPSATYKGSLVYQESSYNKLADNPLPYFCSFILPGTYDTRFDAAGNTFALLNFDLTYEQKKSLSLFVNSLKQDLSKTLIPAFWPPVKEGDPDWSSISGNYSFDFKNEPFHFHNGGIWPVWMGWFCLGLAKQGLKEEVKAIISDFEPLTQSHHWDFQEYITSDQMVLEGKKQMGFTASGIVFMYHALNNNHFKIKLGL